MSVPISGISTRMVRARTAPTLWIFGGDALQDLHLARPLGAGGDSGVNLGIQFGDLVFMIHHLIRKPHTTFRGDGL